MPDGPIAVPRDGRGFAERAVEPAADRLLADRRRPLGALGRIEVEVCLDEWVEVDRPKGPDLGPPALRVVEGVRRRRERLDRRAEERTKQPFHERLEHLIPDLRRGLGQRGYRRSALDRVPPPPSAGRTPRKRPSPSGSTSNPSDS